MRIEIKHAKTGEVYSDVNEPSEDISFVDVFATVLAAVPEDRPPLILTIWGDDGLLHSVQALTRD
jgi:hypothetical protein